MFILFSAMLTGKQYFGDPIDCMVQGVPNSIVNTYCWTHGTYTVKDHEHFTVFIITFIRILKFLRNIDQTAIFCLRGVSVLGFLCKQLSPQISASK